MSDQYATDAPEGGEGRQAPRPAAPPQGPPARPRSAFRGVLTGCVVLAAAVCCVIALSAVAVVLLALVAAVGGATRATDAHGGVQVNELSVSGQPGQPKVVIVPVQGLLVADAGVMGERDPARVLKAMLDTARADADVAAVLLEVDSPGGGMTTCDIMHKYVREYRDEAGDPVVALMQDVAASGGYYVSCAADRIMAHRTTLTGSIGVLMPLFDASGLLRVIGVSDRTVKSGRFKNMGSPFAEKTPDELRAEDQILQSIVQDMHERFVEVVAQGRGLPLEQVRALADGRIYTSGQALENGLIDAIGYEEDAIETAKKLAGLEHAHVVRYRRSSTLLEMVLARAGTRRASSGLDVLPALAAPRPMYLWCPQAAAGLQ